MWAYILAFAACTFSYLYLKLTKNYGLFETYGIFEPPKYFPFGSINNWKVMTGKVHIFRCLNELYNVYGLHHTYLGTFINGTPVLVINDLDIAKNILVRDFDHFMDRRDIKIDDTKPANKYTNNMLTFLKGNKWRAVRKIMSPAFSSGKLRIMVPLIQKASNDLVDYVNSFPATNEFNMLELLKLFTLDCIAACGFGMHVRSLHEPDNKFTQMILKDEAKGKTGLKSFLGSILASWAPPGLAAALRLSFFDEITLLSLARVIKRSIKMRQKSNVKCGDIIDVILQEIQCSTNGRETENAKERSEKFNVEGSKCQNEAELEMLLIANSISLFYFGFETTATSTSVALGFLSRYPHIQEKLYKEIKFAMKTHGEKDLDYDTIQSLPYLDQVVKETLRFYFVGSTERVCTKEYKLPRTNFVVPKGMLVQIPSGAFHRDKRYYPDPNNFNPDENFSNEAKTKRLPFTFLSFGQGPRHCVGMRFATLLTKLCILKMVLNFKIIPGQNMPDKFVHKPGSFSGIPIGGVWCIVTKR